MAGRVDQSQDNVYLRSGFLSLPPGAAVAARGSDVDSASKPLPRPRRSHYVLTPLDARGTHALCPFLAWNPCWRSGADLQRLFGLVDAELVDQLVIYPIVLDERAARRLLRWLRDA